MYAKNYPASKQRKSDVTEQYCLVSFPQEGTHGIWPEKLIWSNNRFRFEAKFGKQWYECRIEQHGMGYYFFLIWKCFVDFFKGTMDDCQKAQERFEKSTSNSNKQWSSAETELSDSEDSVSSSYNVSLKNRILLITYSIILGISTG